MCLSMVQEHKCVLDSCRSLEMEGFHVTYLPVQSNGVIDLKVRTYEVSGVFERLETARYAVVILSVCPSVPLVSADKVDECTIILFCQLVHIIQPRSELCAEFCE